MSQAVTQTYTCISPEYVTYSLQKIQADGKVGGGVGICILHAYNRRHDFKETRKETESKVKKVKYSCKENERDD